MNPAAHRRAQARALGEKAQAKFDALSPEEQEAERKAALERARKYQRMAKGEKA